MKRVYLLGLEDEVGLVEFDNSIESVVYDDDDNSCFVTVCGRLVTFDDSTNSWIQVKRWHNEN